MAESNLAKELKSIDFDLEELGDLLVGKEIYAILKQISSRLEKDELFKFSPNFYSKSRKEQIEAFIPWLARYQKLYDLSDYYFYLSTYYFFPSQMLMSLHFGMFVPCIQFLASDKQREKWLPLAMSLKMTGCYCQSEVAHGSDVQNLEATATLDLATDEFVINTPRISSTKFWPGDMGVFANHAVLYAQVIINNKHLGVQPFMIQIRDMETHEPLPGVIAGDIGPKYGFAAKDNGFLIMKNLRIPRENILGKYCKVTKSGEFKKLGNEKVAYTVMMNTRSLISCDSYHFLAISTVNAMRYSIVRTQFPGPDNRERQLLDYQLQMHKLFSVLADSYLFALGSHKIRSLVQTNIKNVLESENFELTGETHILLCATKAYVSIGCLNGIEKARLACGGHGFSHYSGIPVNRTEQASTATLEGETTVMYLQVARFLMKSYSKHLKHPEIKLKGQVEYLNHAEDLLAKGFSFTNLRDPDAIRELLLINSYYYIKEATNEALEYMSKGESITGAINNHVGVIIVEASQNHAAYYLYVAALERARTFNSKSKAKRYVDALVYLSGLNIILEKPAALIESGFLKQDVYKKLWDLREEIFREIRPKALGLVDAFRYPANMLKSAFGDSEGKIYEKMLDWARENPLNHQKEAPFAGWEFIKQLRTVSPKL